MKKRPNRRDDPPALAKVPRGGSAADSVPQSHFCWRVNKLDWGGGWGWHKTNAKEVLQKIVPKLHEFESMKWGDIDGATGSHFVDCSDLCKDAQKRLADIGQADLDNLYSLRVGGKNRIWGIRDVSTLRVIWWDPGHTVCPSKKKHT